MPLRMQDFRAGAYIGPPANLDVVQYHHAKVAGNFYSFFKTKCHNIDDNVQVTILKLVERIGNPVVATFLPML